MKIGMILETKQAEKTWNALRFGIAALGKDNDVKLFLMGEAVEIESIHDNQYDVSNKLNDFQENGGIVLACGTCLKSRHLEEKTECPISTMNDCVDMVAWSDRTVTF